MPFFLVKIWEKAEDRLLLTSIILPKTDMVHEPKYLIQFYQLQYLYEISRSYHCMLRRDKNLSIDINPGVEEQDN